MNQAQRTFLIKKIDETVQTTLSSLEGEIPEPPSLSNYLLHAVMSGNFEIRNNEEIKELIKQMALKSKDRDDWLGNSWTNSNKNSIYFKASEFFIVPEGYKKLREEYEVKRDQIRQEIRDITIQADTLKTRIQLASDKTLQSMINEVDDMGNISLMDSKLKLLSSGI